MREGTTNVLVITSNSTTHDEADLLASLWAIDKKVREKDDAFFRDKKFVGVDDFLTEWGKLSAVVFRKDGFVRPHGSGVSAKTRNLVWCNFYAHCQLPVTAKDFLEKMDAPWHPWD
jgi:hypothetical protein